MTPSFNPEINPGSRAEHSGGFRRWEPVSFEQVNPPDAPAAASGFADGFEEGKRAGEAAGAQLASAQARQLALLLDAIGCELRVVGEQTARDILDLALTIARQVVRRELSIHPEGITHVVEEAMASLPQGTQNAQLILHPEDATRVDRALGGELSRIQWRIVEDARLAPGGCKIIAPCGDVDATLQTRWAGVLAALGENDAKSNAD
jgi:flagellar assembly protein FliH